MTTPEIKEAVEFEDIFLQDKMERRAYEKSDKRLLFIYECIQRRRITTRFISASYTNCKNKVGIKIISKYTNLSIDEVEELKIKLDM